MSMNVNAGQLDSPAKPGNDAAAQPDDDDNRMITMLMMQGSIPPEQ
jgi:hypothetical protein